MAPASRYSAGLTSRTSTARTLSRWWKAAPDHGAGGVVGGEPNFHTITGPEVPHCIPGQGLNDLEFERDVAGADRHPQHKPHHGPQVDDGAQLPDGEDLGVGRDAMGEDL